MWIKNGNVIFDFSKVHRLEFVPDDYGSMFVNFHFMAEMATVKFPSQEIASDTINEILEKYDVERGVIDISGVTE